MSQNTGQQGRVLAIDYGKKRVGLALSDPTRTIASPLGFKPRNYSKDPEAEELIKELLSLCLQESVAEIVIGEPKRTDGKAHEWLEEVHLFAETLAAKTDLPINLYDERYTTKIAQRTFLEGQKAKQKKSEIDGRAAAVLLTDYLRHCAIIAARVSSAD